MGDNTSLSCTGEEIGNVLIVEDSRTMASLMAFGMRNQLDIEPTICTSYKEAEEHLADCSPRYFAAVLDLHLPDAPKGEIVELVVSRGIPAIVFTGMLSDAMRETMWSKNIVDYVIKDSIDNVQQIISIVKRLRSSKDITILVADDSATSRNLVRDLLKVWRFNVVEAADGRQALRTIQERGHIDLLITDYNMPGMDGIELTREARRTHSKSRLPIIGISSAGDATTTAHFIKAGANDYMHKPFLTEELYCRVISNLETKEYIATIRFLAERDSLTGIYNRHSFFNFGETLFSRFRNGDIGLAAAMVDIDHFKKVNDTYGHHAGDEVIRHVANTLAKRFCGSDLVARIGGEEFCVLCVDLGQDEVEEAFESVRKSIEDAVIRVKDQEIRVTVSIGACAHPTERLDGMLKTADEKLYEAKETGRNKLLAAF